MLKKPTKLKKLFLSIKKPFLILFDIIDRNELSLLWSSVILFSSIALLTRNIPEIILETIPYDGNVFGVAGIIIAIFKISSVLSKSLLIHVVADAFGSTWLIYMGLVVTTSIPPMMLSGAVLITTGVFANYRMLRKLLHTKI